MLSTPAGRFNYDPITRKVTPFPTLGTLSIFWLQDQKHISWKSPDPTTSQIDLIVFPSDAKFTHFKSNIYVLWFQTYEDKYFFWLQSTEQEQQEVQQKIQAAIDEESPPEPVTHTQMQVESPPSSPSPAPAPTTTHPTPPSPPAPKIQGLLQLDSLLSKIIGKNKNKKAQLEALSLTKLLTGDTLKSIEENPGEELLKCLPEGQQDKESLRENLYSPHMQQMMEKLEEALYTEGGVALFYEIGLDLKVLEGSYGTEALLKGISKWAKENGKGKEEEEEKEKGGK